MLNFIKDYFNRANDLPKKERILEKCLIFLEIYLLVSLILEILGILPINIGNYVLVPGLFIYILLNAIKCFKKSIMLSIMLIASLIILVYIVLKGGA